MKVSGKPSCTTRTVSELRSVHNQRVNLFSDLFTAPAVAALRQCLAETLVRGRKLREV